MSHILFQNLANDMLEKIDKYDILMFTQIRKSWLEPALLLWMERRAVFTNENEDEFMVPVAELNKAAAYFERWTDKAMFVQCKQLLNDLPAIQYIHII